MSNVKSETESATPTYLIVRLKPGQKRTLKAAAKAKGLDLSAYARKKLGVI